MMDSPHPPYRPPEAVIEPPDELPPGHIPGIIAEHSLSDDEMPYINSSPTFVQKPQPSVNVDAWQANLQKYGMMDVDDSAMPPERPQVGPGILPRRWLLLAHKHDLYQPTISDLPVAPLKKPPAGSTSDSPLSPRPMKTAEPNILPPPPSPTPSAKTSASAPSFADYDCVCTIADVWDACPGGEHGHHEWYFCPTCWSWIRVVVGRGKLPPVASMEEWEDYVRFKGSFRNKEELDRHRNERFREWSRLNDIKTSKTMATETHHHLHSFLSLQEPSEETRIDRVPVDEKTNAFPHLTLGIDPEDEAWSTFTTSSVEPVLHVSCSSDLWMVVDSPIPGQLPVALANHFTNEKMVNPSPGASGSLSVSEAWTLIAT